jgi:hypothetical protein
MYETLLKKIKENTLTNLEKEKVFVSLKQFVEENPVLPLPWHKRVSEKLKAEIVSPFYSGIFTESRIRSYATLALFLVFVGGGTMLAAKSSLPGETLYPIKIQLNEQLESFTAIGPEEQTAVEIKHLDTRLSEAEALASANKLNDSRKGEIENQINKELGQSAKHVNTLNTQGKINFAKAAEVQINASLKKHKTIIQNILQKTDAKRGDATNLQGNATIDVEASDLHKKIKVINDEDATLESATTFEATSSPSTQNEEKSREEKTGGILEKSFLKKLY